MDFQKKVREIYLTVSGSDNRLEVVNCSGKGETMLPPQEIFKLITGILKQGKFI